MSTRRSKPILIFDGDCGFCRRWILFWKSLTGSRVEYAPYQEVGSDFPQIPSRRFETSVQLVDRDGRVYSGAEAVFRALAVRPDFRWLMLLYGRVPGFRPLSEWFYRRVANHRLGFSRLSYWLWGERPEPSSYWLVSPLFVRGVGLVYLIAFSSLARQVEGLFPLTGPGHFPGFEWDWTLQPVAVLGAVGALVVTLGYLSGALLPLLWLAYLFLANALGEFLWFQWDSLLLETGLLAVLVPGLGWTPRSLVPPPALVRWLYRWLLFRVVFFSGWAKLASGDPSWRSLTALQYHFETQPLPTWLGWLTHALSGKALQGCAVLMFLAELAAPILYFFPRKPRLFAFICTAILMLGINLSGNYGFFGWNAFVLSLWLLDDQALRRLVPRRLLDSASARGRPPGPPARARRWAVAAYALVALSVTALGARSVSEAVAPLRSFNGYGVFAVMTTVRNEIVIEGSDDQANWKEYEFKWKPGSLSRRPAVLPFHMPRLDWQMWFAALGTYDRNAWFQELLQELLRNDARVLELLHSNPFPGQPPNHIRSTLYRYRFTTPVERAQTGDWWRRERLGPYSPVLSRSPDATR